MKLTFAIFLIALVSSGLTLAAEPLYKTGAWNLPQGVYAQMKIIPTGERGLGSKPDGVPEREVHDWNGPWEIYPTFQISITFNTGKGLQPKPYDYVQPNVGLEGRRGEGNRASHIEGVWLFDGPSAPQDILMQPYPIKGEPELDKEYKVAAISSQREKLAWDVYIRFQTTKPAYVKLETNDR